MKTRSLLCRSFLLLLALVLTASAVSCAASNDNGAQATVGSNDAQNGTDTPSETTDPFEELAKGLEDVPEGGRRCSLCYSLRLENTFIYAKENNFDYVTTTLTVSPYKNAEKLNTIGEELSLKYGIKYLISDFKKKGGYKLSCENSVEYGLYRQNYCGCSYSKRLAVVKEVKYYKGGVPSSLRLYCESRRERGAKAFSNNICGGGDGVGGSFCFFRAEL